ncbi:MAG: TonB family protein [Lewinellaceae bacterium]|nr:TonB family protein [Lewinellaceae bacterium]
MDPRKRERYLLKRPAYPGGDKALLAFIKEHLQYPPEAIEKEISGTVRIRYTINYEGKVIRSKVLSSLGHGCDEEAQRLVGLLQFDVPRNHFLKAEFHKTLNIHFRLPKPTAPPPAVATTYQYTVTTSRESPAAKGPPASEEENGFSYTITLGS